MPEQPHQAHHLPPGHDRHQARHSAMVFVVLGGVILSQLAIVMWKTHRNVSLVGLYIIPFGFSIRRMLIIFVIFSLVTGFIINRALRKPMERETPRIVYMWFYRIFQICSNIALLGYILMILDFFFNLKEHELGTIGSLLIFYGMYYGVLGRDFSEVCSERMAQTMGFTGKKDEISMKRIDTEVCGICGGELNPSPNSVQKKYPIYKLSCDHEFHEPCVRGWIIIGKKDTCPYCSEKVSYQPSLLSNPWEKQSVLWGQVLDYTRYLLVWNPIIIYVLNHLVAFLDPEDAVAAVASNPPA